MSEFTKNITSASGEPSCLPSNEERKEWATERKRLTESNSDLRKFAEILTHEINSQMQPAVMALSIINSKHSREMGEKLHRMSHLGLDSLNSLSGFMREMLELLDHRDFETEDYPEIDLAVVARTAIDQLETIESFDSASVNFDIGELPVVKGSPSRYLHVFSNLIRNALTHGKVEKKHLGIEIGSFTDESKGEVIFVKDDGRGIAEEDRSKVFDHFYRSTSAKGRTAGSGIGLALCRYVIEQSGGKIWLESEAGKGSSFYFAI
ncbi:MAG: sensor histidine kinase [Luteolibacter sp.]